MNYKFDINQLDILTVLTFDASIEFEDLLNEPINGQIIFEVERRTVENVKRRKLLFWDKTEYLGKCSKIQMKGVISTQFGEVDGQFSNNHFIDSFRLNESNGEVELITSFGYVVSFKVNDDFQIELMDIRDSEFGKGFSFGKHGFTDDEWKHYLIKKKFSL